MGHQLVRCGNRKPGSLHERLDAPHQIRELRGPKLSSDVGFSRSFQWAGHVSVAFQSPGSADLVASGQLAYDPRWLWHLKQNGQT